MHDFVERPAGPNDLDEHLTHYNQTRYLVDSECYAQNVDMVILRFSLV